MFFHQYKVLVWMGKVCAFVFALASLASSTAQADTLAPGYVVQSYNSVVPDGQFTAYDGQIHYWTSAGYQIYNTTTGSTTAIGPPPNGTLSNGYGDAFGVFDPANNVFYAATLANNGAYLYQYNSSAGTWSNSTSAGVYLASAYGGQVYNGQLYVSGLPATWNGSLENNEILAFGQTAIPNGPSPQTLIQTSGYSADLAIAPDGDVYYGTNDTDKLYRWTAAQVAGVTSTPLTIADAQLVCTMPGGGSGLAVNAAGNVFFTANSYDSENYSSVSTLAIVNPQAPNGYDEIYTSSTDWFGAISVDGNFLHGGALYFTPGFNYGSTNSLVAIQAVPEPGSLALLAAALAVALAAWRWRRS